MKNGILQKNLSFGHTPTNLIAFNKQKTFLFSVGIQQDLT